MVLLSFLLNPFTPMSDQDRISPYQIDTISNRQVMRKNVSAKGLLVDPIPNSQSLHYKSCIANGRENY